MSSCWRFKEDPLSVEKFSEWYNIVLSQKYLNTENMLRHNMNNVFTFNPSDPMILVSQNWNRKKTFFESIHMERNFIGIILIPDMHITLSGKTQKEKEALRSKMNSLVTCVHGDEIVTSNVESDLETLRIFHLYSYRVIFTQQYHNWLAYLTPKISTSIKILIKSIEHFQNFCEKSMYPKRLQKIGTRLFYNIKSNLRLIYQSTYLLDTHEPNDESKGYVVNYVGFIRQTYISSEDTSFHFKSFHGGLKLSEVKCWELIKFYNNDALEINYKFFNNDPKIYDYFGGNSSGAINLRKQIVIDLTKLFQEINNIVRQDGGNKRKLKKL